MTSHPSPLALLYDDDAYVEAPRRAPEAAAGRAAGLMGRHVAGKEFLNAYLGHDSWDELVALVRNHASAETLVRSFREHPSSRSRRRRLRIIDERRFHDEFLPSPPASPLHLPCPLEPRYAWARQGVGPAAFALSGVTHTLCSVAAVRQLCELVTAPFEPFDSLICTSTAVVDMVRAVTDCYAESLRDRHGGSPALRVRLEHIPLGVDTDRFRPPTPEERQARRAALGVGADEVVVLFVGRLSHHAKAHPYPMFQGLARAARESGKAVHLILAGWAVNAAVHSAFAGGARLLAPGVRVTILDGTDPVVRSAVWHAADIFTSLSDNIQETFGLVVVEAMACGLPVVASDWDGYRDLVKDGETGYLVPTLMVAGATRGLTARLLMGELNYDHFLAECSQGVTVDVGRAAEAYRRLLDDADLRRRLGEAGRRTASVRFAWPRIIEAYQSLWSEQEAERLAVARRCRPARTDAAPDGPALYPDPERSFRGYPTLWLSGEDRLEAVSGAQASLDAFLRLPLTNHVADRRVSDPAVLRQVLAGAAHPRPVAELEDLLRRADVRHRDGRATLAWLLKYGLLRHHRGANDDDEAERAPGAEP